MPTKRNFWQAKVPFCLSKPQAWHIIAARRAVYITKGGEAAFVSHHAQRAFSLRLDEIHGVAVMIYNGNAVDSFVEAEAICAILCGAWGFVSHET